MQKMTSTSPQTNSLVQSILQLCGVVQRAVLEYGESPVHEQQEVWNDLTGEESSRWAVNNSKGAVNMYGTNDPYEPVDLVVTSLCDFDEELEAIPVRQKKALVRVLDRTPSYAQDPLFRLKFLRAEKFDAKLAALRFVRHFEEKLQLFQKNDERATDEIMGREITLDDLNEDDFETLEGGYLQVLTQPDCGNRKVLFYYRACSDCYKDRENLLRSFWYVANKLSQEEEVQKRGIANVVYNVGGFPEHGMDYEKSRRIALLFRAIPVRMTTFFPCVDDVAWVTVVETFSVLISRFLRIRLRVITGNHEEVMAKLQAVGIPSRAMPVTASSALLLDDHLDWLENLLVQEIEGKREEMDQEIEGRKEDQDQEMSDDKDIEDNDPPELTVESMDPEPRKWTLYGANTLQDLVHSTSSHYSAVG